MANSVKLEWSEDALADLDRFSDFLQAKYPALAPLIAREIIAKAGLLSRYPKAGRPIGGREEYRQLALRIVNATYVFQYRFDGDRLVMLRVFHGREERG